MYIISKKNDRKKLYLSKILGKKNSTTSTTTRAPWAQILTDMDTEMDRQQQQTNFTGQQKKKSVNYRSTARRQRQRSMKNCFDYNHNRLCYVYGYFYDENVFMRTTFIVKWHGFSFGNYYLIVNKNSV